MQKDENDLLDGDPPVRVFHKEWLVTNKGIPTGYYGVMVDGEIMLFPLGPERPAVVHHRHPVIIALRNILVASAGLVWHKGTATLRRFFMR